MRLMMKTYMKRIAGKSIMALEKTGSLLANALFGQCVCHLPDHRIK